MGFAQFSIGVLVRGIINNSLSLVISKNQSISRDWGRQTEYFERAKPSLYLNFYNLNSYPSSTNANFCKTYLRQRLNEPQTTVTDRRRVVEESYMVILLPVNVRSNKPKPKIARPASWIIGERPFRKIGYRDATDGPPDQIWRLADFTSSD